jgi:type IV pilus biogenesis protein CpaD/CtpE
MIMAAFTVCRSHIGPLAFCAALVLAGCAAPKPAEEAAQSPCLATAERLDKADDGGMPAYRACANEANLKAMVANPADLEAGEPAGPANGERETLAVSAYEKGQTKPLSQTSTQTQIGTSLGTGQ